MACSHLLGGIKVLRSGPRSMTYQLCNLGKILNFPSFCFLAYKMGGNTSRVVVRRLILIHLAHLDHLHARLHSRHRGIINE